MAAKQTASFMSLAPLADEKVFNHPTLFHGVITWNDSATDIAPEAVCQDSYAYDSEAIQTIIHVC